MGIFPPRADGTDINAAARSPDGTVTATADDFGMVKLFRSPCPVEKAAFQQYNGHSSHVTNVDFTKGVSEGYLMSTGGEDKSVFQWKFIQAGKNMPEEKQPQETMKVDISGRGFDREDNYGSEDEG